MARLKLCGGCGVPLMVGKGQLWRENGTIVESRDPDHRMLFCESDNLDALFGGIENIIDWLPTWIGMAYDRSSAKPKSQAGLCSL